MYWSFVKMWKLETREIFISQNLVNQIIMKIKFFKRRSCACRLRLCVVPK